MTARQGKPTWSPKDIEPGRTTTPKRPRKQTETLVRYYGDMKVVEAKNAVMLHITEADVKGAIPRDPHNCAFAQACRRIFESTTVSFMRSYSYMDMVGSDGIRRLYRFKNPVATKRVIEEFDRTRKMPVGLTFRLDPMPKGHTLDRKKKRADKYNKRKQAGEVVIRASISSKSFSLRNGSGMIQFRHDHDEPDEPQKIRLVASNNKPKG